MQKCCQKGLAGGPSGLVLLGLDPAVYAALARWAGTTTCAA